MSTGYPYAIIAVADRPLCIWDHDLKEHNEQFCSKLDAHWFSESVDRLAASVGDGEVMPQPVALSIRLTFHHALETFFAILFASLQAPECIPAWLAHYQLADLRQLIERVRNQSRILNAWGRPRFTWADLSNLIHDRAGWSDEGATARRFGEAWARLASEFLDDKNRSEYNSMKHGLRAAPGGGGLRIGEQTAPGVPAPPEAMHWLGHSRHGSSAFYTDPIPQGRSPKKTSHFQLKRENVLWLPETTVGKTHLLSMSIANAISAVRVGLGAQASGVQFHRFADPEGFDLLWNRHPGLNHFQINHSGPPEAVAEIDDEQLIQDLRARSGWNDASLADA